MAAFLLRSRLLLALFVLGTFSVTWVALARAQAPVATTLPAAAPLAASPPPAATSTAPAATLAVRDASAAASRPSVRPAPSYELAEVRSGASVSLLSRPSGPSLGRLGDRTEFGSATVLSVVETRAGGHWLGVSAPQRANGELAWIRRDATRLRFSHTSYSLHADLSGRRLELRSGRRVLVRMTVAVGRDGSPTPTGRYAVTDELRGDAYGPYYGCCVMALSAHQPHTPVGWTGGSRVAIHGTNTPSTIGQAISAGCLHATDRDMRMLMRRVPAGAPVFIAR